MTVQQYRARALRDNLPPVTRCDYDIGMSNNDNTGTNPLVGEIPWLVGGNQQDQLREGRVPYTGANQVYDLGIDVQGNDGINIITDRTNRIRIMGEEENCMNGRVIISNGFIENRECEAILLSTPSAPLSTLDSSPISITDVFLPRPANAYNVFINDTSNLYLIPFADTFTPITFVEDLGNAITTANPGIDPNQIFTMDAFTTLVDADPLSAAGLLLSAMITTSTMPRQVFIDNVYGILSLLQLNMLPGQRVLFINNIFLGDPSIPPPINVLSYDPNTRVDQSGIGTLLYTDMNVSTFDYLLKIINQSVDDVAIVFNTGNTGVVVSGIPTTNTLATGMTIYSNANIGGAGSFFLPSGGGAFYTMRTELGTTHIMLSNVVYRQYTEV